VWDYAGAITSFNAPRDPGIAWLAWIALVIALPALLAPLAAALRSRSQRPDFWRRLEQLALAYAVGGASLACALASVGEFGNGGWTHQWVSPVVCGAVAVVAGIATLSARPGLSGRMAGAIMAGAGLVLPLAYAARDLDIPAAALFMALWVGIAAAALVAGWRGVFQLSIGVIALRLIVLSFELASDLLLSGFGLILSGFMILGVAWVAVRVSKTFAPPSEGAGA
jgi:hypothetical protein